MICNFTDKFLCFLNLNISIKSIFIICEPFVISFSPPFFRKLYNSSVSMGDMLPPLIEVGASRSRILPNPVSTS